jgi:F-type H+-transporting ATPase subunit a|tara:strand:+ start:607 stop:1539 length:933 start_codon:yes stop_codon:yes gene_type:complete
MIYRPFLIVLALFVTFPVSALFGADETAGEHGPELITHADAHADDGHHSLPTDAVVITEIGPFAITNSMLVTWVVALGLIIVAQIATKKPKLVPSGLQNFVEWLVESLIEFFQGILGTKLAKETFWFFGTVFVFILFSNWFGLIPGVGTIGWDVDAHGHVHKPLLRGVNADLNMTASMSLFFFALWLYWSFKSIGPGGFFFHIFDVKGHGFSAMGIFLLLIYISVGLVELVSISLRPVALMFRLYGNVFAGENILETVMGLGGKYFGWLTVLPFYFLELLVGLVQALVFALLTAVFTSLMCSHHEEDHSH